MKHGVITLTLRCKPQIPHETTASQTQVQLLVGACTGHKVVKTWGGGGGTVNVLCPTSRVGQNSPCLKTSFSKQGGYITK
jgi:hypothetical protein